MQIDTGAPGATRMPRIQVHHSVNQARQMLVRTAARSLCVCEDGRVVGFVDAERLSLAGSDGRAPLAQVVDNTLGVAHWIN